MLLIRIGRTKLESSTLDLMTMTSKWRYYRSAASSDVMRWCRLQYGHQSNEFYEDLWCCCRCCCCRPLHWDADVIHFFAQGSRGMGGIIMSIKYSVNFYNHTSPNFNRSLFTIYIYNFILGRLFIGSGGSLRQRQLCVNSQSPWHRDASDDVISSASHGCDSWKS